MTLLEADPMLAGLVGVALVLGTLLASWVDGRWRVWRCQHRGHDWRELRREHGWVPGWERCRRCGAHRRKESSGE